MKRDLTYISIAITAIQDILSYTEDSETLFPEETFLADKKLRHAVLAHLMVIGEYLGKVSPETQASYPSNVWKDAKFARNFYIHQYDGIEWPYVYNSVTMVLIPTLSFLKRVQKDLEINDNHATH